MMRITETIYEEYVDHLLSGNKVPCHEIVNQLLDMGTEIRALYEDLFQRSLYEVGELWEENRISVAHEHLATSITESLLLLVYPKLFAADHIGRKAIISCSVNEFHQIGGKMVADMFELNGWDGYFLGANTPTKDLMQMIDEFEPDVVCLSLSIYENIRPLMETIENIRRRFPELPVLVGGQAFRWGGTDDIAQFPRTTYIQSIADLESLIQADSRTG